MPTDQTADIYPPKKLSIAVYDGSLDRVHYAFVMAAATAALGIPVTMFFTMEACRVLLKSSVDGAVSTSDMDTGLAAKGVATFTELLEACAEMDVKFMVCEMGLVARDMHIEDLRDDLSIEIVGFVTFIMDARADGQMIFV